jgi:DNA-binding beta-propeller fold protein YncE
MHKTASSSKLTETECGPTLIDSDPYGLVIGEDGMVYVADAGGNDIIKVDPTTGETSVLAMIPGLPG